MAGSQFEVEPDGLADLGVCPCCNSTRTRVWGYVHRIEGPTVAAYFVEWAESRSHGARFDLAWGPWGEGAAPEDRFWTSAEYRAVVQQRGFRMADASAPAGGSGTVATRALTRQEALDTGAAPELFDVLEAILLLDERLATLRAW